MNDLMKDVKNNMAKTLFGTSIEDAMAKGRCIQCKEEALPKCYSEAGRREFKISGLCEPCFDEVTTVPAE